MADRMAVFMDGRIIQIGTPEEVFNRPSSMAVAAFLGNPPMNLLPASVAGGRVTVEGSAVDMPMFAGLGTRELMLGVRPSAVRIGDDGLPAAVTMCESLGEEAIVDLSVGTQLVRAKVRASELPREGENVRLRFDASGLHAFDRATGLRLDLRP